jgi:hypothetical protein
MNLHFVNKFTHRQQIEKNNMICQLHFSVVQNMEKFTIKKTIMKLWHKYINHLIIVNLWPVMVELQNL